jgi:hypothetical protein
MTTGPILVLRQTELHESWRIEVCTQGFAPVTVKLIVKGCGNAKKKSDMNHCSRWLLVQLPSGGRMDRWDQFRNMRDPIVAIVRIFAFYGKAVEIVAEFHRLLMRVEAELLGTI